MDSSPNQEDGGDGSADEILRQLVDVLETRDMDVDNLVQVMGALDKAARTIINIFYQNRSTLDLCINALLAYGLDMHISNAYPNDPSIYQLYITTLTNLIIVHNVKNKNMIIKYLYEQIDDLLNSLDSVSKTLTTLGTSEKQDKISVDTKGIASALTLDLDLLESLLNHISVQDINLLIILNNVLQKGIPEYQIRALRCLRHIIPLSYQYAYQNFRIAAAFVRTGLSALVEKYPEASELCGKIAERSLNRIPYNTRLILGREIMNEMMDVDCIEMNEVILKAVREFAEADRAGEVMVQAFLTNKMTTLYESQIYINTCKELAHRSEAFVESLRMRYSENPLFFPALIEIINFQVPRDAFDICTPDITVKICARMKEIPEFAVPFLKNAMKSANPSDEDLQRLTRFVSEEIFEVPEKYPAERLARIYQKSKSPPTPMVRGWVRYTDTTLSNIPFFSMLTEMAYKRNVPTSNEITNAFARLPNTIELWNIPEFRHCAGIVLSNEDLYERYSNLIDDFGNDSLEWLNSGIGDFFINNKVTENNFIKFIFEKFNSPDSIQAAHLFCICHRAGKHFYELYFKNRYELSLLLFRTSNTSEIRFCSMVNELVKSASATLGRPSVQKILPFNLLKKELFPILISKTDDDAITKYTKALIKESNPQCDSELTQSFIKEKKAQFTKEAAPYSFAYLFSHFDKHDIFGQLNFLTTTLCNTTASQLMDDCIGELITQMLLFLGDTDENVIKRTLNGIGVILKADAQLKSKSKTTHESTSKDRIEQMWDENQLHILLTFQRTIDSATAPERARALRALTYSLKSLSKNLNTLGPKFLLMVDVAMATPELREECFAFYNEYIKIIGRNQYPKIFAHVVSQLLPYQKEYPTKVNEIFSTLLESNAACVSALPLVSLIPELNEMKDIQKFILPIKWHDHFTLLINALESSPPALQNLIVKQLIILMKQDPTEALSIGSEQAMSIWNALNNNPRTEFAEMCGRCLACTQLRGVSDSLSTETVPSTLDVDDVMRTIITKYLVQMFEDSDSFAYHSKVAVAIQELLKALDCYIEDPKKKKRTQDRSRGDRNWEAFPEDVRVVIEKYRSSRFTLQQPSKEDAQTGPFFDGDAEAWLPRFVGALLNVRSDSDLKDQKKAQMLRCISFILRRIPSLCSYLLPILCIYQRQNDAFLDILQEEFRHILKKLDQPPAEQARIAMQELMAAFDVMAIHKVYPSRQRHIIGAYYLEIADDEELATAAAACQLYATALQHLENAIRNDWEKMKDRSISQERLRAMKQIYKHLNESDGMDTIRRMMPKNAMRDDSFIIGEQRMLSLGGKATESMRISYLKKVMRSGRYERALTDAQMQRSAFASDMRVDSIFARAAVRLGRWDAVESLSSSSPSYGENDREAAILDSTDIAVAKALFQLKQNEYESFKEIINGARKQLVQPLMQASHVAFEKALPSIMCFHVLEEVDEFGRARQSKSELNLGRWSQWTDRAMLSVDDVERLVSVRAAMLKIAIANKEESKQLISQQWLILAKACRKSGEFFRAQMACNRAAQVDKSNPMTTLEAAKIAWAQKQTNQAISLASVRPTNGLDKETEGKFVFLKAQWSAETNSLDPDELYDEYRKSANLITSNGKAYYALASLADERITSYITNLEGLPAPSKRNISKFYNEFSTTPANFFRTQIPLALTNYMKALVMTPQVSYEVIPRVLALYFDIGKYFTNGNEVVEGIPPVIVSMTVSHKDAILSEMTSAMESGQRSVCSAVWLNSLTQLISRVEQPSKLESQLNNLIIRATQDYPYQALWQLMSIKHSQFESRPRKYAVIMESCSRQLGGDRSEKMDTMRRAYEKITSGIRQLTTASPGSSKNRNQQADILCPQLRDSLENCGILMPTSELLKIPPESPAFSEPALAARPTTIVRMEKDIVIFNSLMHPKRISLVGSNGEQYHYLCKQDDDLRKDMRLMEFASFVNRIFGRDRRCRERSLAIVTYAVICLDERCGIIEWVEHTTHFRSIISGLLKEGGYGLSASKLRELFCDNESKNMTKTTMEKIQRNFRDKVLPAYPPMLHLWFIDQFKDPQRWFQARLNFTRSTAVWSMVGYIVGLGDRHSENILFNTKTGGVVHVDFCCLFDKAKSLPVPERVPFRLTQNFVDALGVLGTDGPFSACSAYIMEALRAKRHKLVSVLQTFAHDPLLEWKKASAATVAKMTIKEVGNRLAGLSDDKSIINSPECVVKDLIKKATDNNNLALMYLGWSPHL